MDNNDNHIRQILDYLAKAAAVAADGVTGAMQQAGNAVGGKYSQFKWNMELGRLHSEQAKLFEDLGRTLFMVKTGAFESPPAAEGEEPIDGQEMVDQHLDLAMEKQAEIDEISSKIKENSGERVCSACGRVAEYGHVYCPACGAKLPEEEAEEPAPQKAADEEEKDSTDTASDKDKKDSDSKGKKE